MAPKAASSKGTVTKAVKKPAKGSAPAKTGKLETIKNLFLGKKKGADKTASPAKTTVKATAKKAEKKTEKKAPVAKAAASAKGATKPQAQQPVKTAKEVASKKVTAAKTAVPSKEANPAKAAKGKGKGARKGSSAALTGRVIDPNSNHCREVACESLASASGYCRLHYIKNWKKIKRKETIMKEGRLNQYIEELVAKYPEKYLEAIRVDLANDKEFVKVIRDLELDESIDDFEGENESVEGIVENIRRDMDDDGDF